MSIISIPNGTRWKKDPIPPPKYPYKITINCPDGQVDIEVELNDDPSKMTAGQLAHAINMAGKGLRAEVINGNNLSIEFPKPSGRYSIEGKARRIGGSCFEEELILKLADEEQKPACPFWQRGPRGGTRAEINNRTVYRRGRL